MMIRRTAAQINQYGICVNQKDELLQRTESSSIQLTGTGQMLEIEMIAGEKTTYSYSDRTHVHQPTRITLGSGFTGQYMDYANPETGYENLVIRLSSPKILQLEKPLA